MPTKCTPLELEVLREIVLTEYNSSGDHPIGYQTWSQGFFSKKLTGAVSSCVKKGWVKTFSDGKDSTMSVTADGYATFLDNCNEQDRGYCEANWPSEKKKPAKLPIQERSTVEVIAELFGALQRKGWKRIERHHPAVYWGVTMRKMMAHGGELCLGVHEPGDASEWTVRLWIGDEIAGPYDDLTSDYPALATFNRPTPVAVILEAAEAYFASFCSGWRTPDELYAVHSIEHNGAGYRATGKRGTDMATGQASAEFERRHGDVISRVWKRQDGTVTVD